MRGRTKASLLIELNGYRAALSKPPIKRWRSTLDKLSDECVTQRHLAAQRKQTEVSGTFMCESAVFNGPHCIVQCDSCKPRRKRK